MRSTFLDQYPYESIINITFSIWDWSVDNTEIFSYTDWTPIIKQLVFIEQDKLF